MSTILRRLRDDERGLTALEWLGIALAVLTILSLIPQFRAAIDVLYENLVGKNNVGPDGHSQPGVLVRGIIVGVGSFAVFVGSIFLLNYTNLGRRLAFLVTGAAFFGTMAIIGLFYSLYAPRGIRPTNLEGLNSFDLRILPMALLLGSLILMGMFLTALHRLELEQTEEAA
jgi:Flp pilus assembly pilin Flp